MKCVRNVSYFYNVAFNLDSIHNSKYFHINFRIGLSIEIGIDFFFIATHIYINTAYVYFKLFCYFVILILKS